MNNTCRIKLLAFYVHFAQSRNLNKISRIITQVKKYSSLLLKSKNAFFWPKGPPSIPELCQYGIISTCVGRYIVYVIYVIQMESQCFNYKRKFSSHFKRPVCGNYCCPVHGFKQDLCQHQGQIMTELCFFKKNLQIFLLSIWSVSRNKTIKYFWNSDKSLILSVSTSTSCDT